MMMKDDGKLIISRRGFLVGAAVAGIASLFPADIKEVLAASDDAFDEDIVRTTKGLFIHTATWLQDAIDVTSPEDTFVRRLPGSSRWELEGQCNFETSVDFMYEELEIKEWLFELPNSMTFKGSFMITKLECLKNPDFIYSVSLISVGSIITDLSGAVREETILL